MELLEVGDVVQVGDELKHPADTVVRFDIKSKSTTKSAGWRLPVPRASEPTTGTSESRFNTLLAAGPGHKQQQPAKPAQCPTSFDLFAMSPSLAANTASGKETVTSFLSHASRTAGARSGPEEFQRLTRRLWRRK
jgi:hypothetical protein